MPMYLYTCNTCGKREERIRKLAERDQQTTTCAKEGNEGATCPLVREEVSQTAGMGMNWADWKGAG